MCPVLRLGVDVGSLGFVDCAGVCCSPQYGADPIQAVSHISDVV